MAGLNKICIHWSAGSYSPNAIELKAYHFIIDNNGKVYNGTYKPEDNINCQDGKYAAHCGGGNTGCIGVSMLGMAGYCSRTKVGKYPLTKLQVEAMFKKCAELCKKYGIPVDNSHVFTHMEFGQKHPNTSSRGKIDICYLPPYPEVKQDEVGKFIRSKISWYLSKM